MIQDSINSKNSLNCFNIYIVLLSGCDIKMSEYHVKTFLAKKLPPVRADEIVKAHNEEYLHDKLDA